MSFFNKIFNRKRNKSSSCDILIKTNQSTNFITPNESSSDITDIVCMYCDYKNNNKSNYCINCGMKLVSKKNANKKTTTEEEPVFDFFKEDDNVATEDLFDLLEDDFNENELTQTVNDNNSQVDDDQIVKLVSDDENIVFDFMNNYLSRKETSVQNKTVEINVKNTISNDSDKIKSIIESTFEDIGINAITTTKLLGRIYALDEELIKKYNFDEISIMNFIKKNYEYYVNGNFISKSNIKSIHEIVITQLSSKEQIKHNDISKLFDKIGYENHKSYSVYFNDLINIGFVSINKEELLKENLFVIENSDLQKIEKVIDFILSEKNAINISKNIKIYLLMPKVKYDWNQYLLKSIIEKYFSNKYVLKQLNDDYVVRRK